jgi:hypothetical protein
VQSGDGGPFAPEMVACLVIEPRFAWSPPRSRSLGAECVDFWLAAGGVLFDWQRLVIEGMLGLDGEDRWASSNDGLDVARQNGKGVILQAIEAFVAFELGKKLGYKLVTHTAHEFATSLEHQYRLEEMIQNAPHLHAKVRDKGGYVHANGQESIRLKDGTRIIFKARTKGGGRGYSGDLLVWDEAMVLPAAVVGAQKPMLRASQGVYGPKVIYAGSAVDQEVHEHGVPFALIRERGIAKAASVSWHEWSAPFEHPSEMSEEVLRDRSWWRLANPSMDEGLILEDHMADEIETMPARTVAVELGGVGDWPVTDGTGTMVIDLARWDGLVDLISVPVDPVCFAFDISPDRAYASIGVAGFREDGLRHVEVVDRRQGTGWLVPRLVELWGKHSPAAIACDSSGPAASLIPDLEREGIEVLVVKMNDYVRGCGIIFDLVEEGSLRHLGTPEMRSALRGAAKRPLGDAWAWSRKNSGVDITPIVSITLALFANAVTKQNPDPLLAVAFC